MLKAVRETRVPGINFVCFAGYICLLALLLSVGVVRASEEVSQNKLLPVDEKEDGGRFFFSTTSSSTGSTSPTVTLTLGTGDILFAVLAVALSVAAVVVLAGLLLGTTQESTGYSAPS